MTGARAAQRLASWVLLVLALAACGPQPTPFPVDVPVTPSPQTPTERPPVRYALAPNTVDAVPDLDGLRASAQVEQLADEPQPDDLGARYDMVVMYGAPDGWTEIGTIDIALLLRVDDQRLTAPLAEIVQRAIDQQAVLDELNAPGATVITPSAATPASQLRALLANRGRPDGLSLVLGHDHVPGAGIIAAQLERANVFVRLDAMTTASLSHALDDGLAQVALVRYASDADLAEWQARYGAENVIPLLRIPLSYRAVPGLNVTLRADDWPLAGWQ